MAANLRYLTEGISGGVFIGLGLSGQLEYPAAAIGIGGYLAADLAFQAANEFSNYLNGEKRLGACEQPATLAVEVGYHFIEKLIRLIE